MDIQTKSNGATCRIPAMFPWPLDSMKIPDKGYGLGNPLSTSPKNVAQPWREQVGYWVFVRDIATGDLVLPGGSTIGYFQTGEQEAPPASKALPNFVQNLATTNLFKKGAPVTRDNLFAMIAMGIAIGRPFGVSQAEDGTLGKQRLYCPWADSYGARARDAMWISHGYSVQFRDAACNFELGNAANYPPAGGQTGAETVRAGGGFGVMGMLPIARGPVYLGAVDESNQAIIVATSTEEDIVLCNDALAKTEGALVVPTMVTAYGDFGPWCGPCAPSNDDIEALVEKRMGARIAQLEARFSQMNSKG